MKAQFVIVGLLLSLVVSSQQPVSPIDYQSGTDGLNSSLRTNAQVYRIVERGQHHRVWQRITWQTNSAGAVFATTNSYTELETGMHRKGAQGEWIECSPEIQIQPDGGAAATNVQHRLYLPGSLYSDAIECVTSDGKVLTSRPLGLSFFDGETNVLIAELRDGPTGQLLPSGNHVIYTNICNGSRLDLLLTSKKAGYEADLVIREQLPDPAAFGFGDASKVRIQWWTEFFNPPSPSINNLALFEGSPVDQQLDFGEAKMGPGVAYLIGDQGSAATVPVTKQWVGVDGRTFLVEEVPLAKIADQLATLPVHTASLTSPRNDRSKNLAAVKPGSSGTLRSRGHGWSNARAGK